MIDPPSSILIVNTRLIGDVLLTTPLVQLLLDAFPGVSIDFLVNAGTGEFLEKDSRIRKVIYSEKWEKSSSDLSSTYLAALFRKYDLAITMNTADRGAVAVAFASCRYRVGFFQTDKPFSTFFRKLLYSHPLMFDPDLHIVMLCAQIAGAIGVEFDRLMVRIFWDQSDEKCVASFLKEHEVGGPYFVVHPFARWRYKYWDIKRFCEVNDRIATDYGMQPVWTSSPDKDEIALLKEASAGCKVAPVLVPGIFSLNQMACLLNGASLYLGLDTAITHIAASVGLPMVALYGPTELWRWHPWDNKNSFRKPLPSGYRGAIRSGRIVTLQADCDHYPCVRPHCYAETENPCMMALTTDAVCSEVDQLLAVGKGDLVNNRNDC